MNSKNVRRNPIVKQTLAKLYQDRNETGDVTFIVDSEKVRVHRCILAALSPKYKAQFFGSRPDEGDIHVHGDITAAAFQEFLQFFYLDEVVLTIENIENVFDLVQQSLVDDFSNECINFLKDIVSVDSLCVIYRLASIFGIEELLDICEPQISANAQKIFVSNDFINCESDLLITILQMDSLRCREIEVFDACISWAKAACERKNIDPDQMSNLRSVLGAAIFEIRFCSMKIEEFVILHRKYHGFFSPDESDEIIFMIGKLADFKSQQFNQKPRNQPINLPSKIRHECFRILPQNIRLIDLTGIQSIGVNFYCNKGIRLDGFAAGVDVSTNAFAVYVGVQSLMGVHEYFLDCTVQANEEGYAIMFNKPIEIRQDDGVVEIRMEVELGGSCSAYRLSDLMRVPVNENQSDDFVFSLFSENAVDLITRLFFSPSDDGKE